MTSYKNKIEKGRVYSAYVVDQGGIPEAVTKMALGNNIGVKFDKYAERAIFQPALGAFIVEVDIKAVNYLLELPGLKVIGVTQANPVIEWADQSISLKEIQATYESSTQSIYSLCMHPMALAKRWRTSTTNILNLAAHP